MGLYEIAKERCEKEGLWCEIHMHDENTSRLIITERETLYKVAYMIPERSGEEVVKEYIDRMIYLIREYTQGLNNATLDKIEKALGIRFYDWQREFILGNGIEFIQGRCQGRTTAHTIKQLIESKEPLLITGGNKNEITDGGFHGEHYVNHYIRELYKMKNKLAEKGIQTRVIIDQRHGKYRRI